MINNFKGKKVLVMGLGLQGGALSVVKWLLKNKAIITITDIKTRVQLKPTLDKIAKLPGAKNIKYTLNKHDLADFENQDLIVQNPGVPKESKYLAKATSSFLFPALTTVNYSAVTPPFSPSVRSPVPMPT